MIELSNNMKREKAASTKKQTDFPISEISQARFTSKNKDFKQKKGDYSVVFKGEFSLITTKIIISKDVQ